MNFETVVFAFFTIFSCTLNFGFFIGDLGNPNMHHASELFAAIVVNLIALASSRLPALITAMAVQGMALGAMPLLLEDHFDWMVSLVAVCTIAGKGFVIPYLLRRAMRMATFFFVLDTFRGLVHMLKVDGLLWNWRVWRW